MTLAKAYQTKQQAEKRFPGVKIGLAFNSGLGGWFTYRLGSLAETIKRLNAIHKPYHNDHTF